MNKSDDTALLLGQLTRIADALERKHPIDMAPGALPQADAYVWQSDIRQLVAVAKVNRLDIGLLRESMNNVIIYCRTQWALCRDFRRITRCYGARAVRANHHWSRRFMER